jgi:hypothetical protein
LEKYKAEFHQDIRGNIHSPLDRASCLHHTFEDGDIDSAALHFSSSVPRAWVENHWCEIVYKLASVAYSIPSLECFSYERAMRQLESRFEREVQGSCRSAIRKIVERDAACGRYLVLYIAKVVDDGKRIVLSDGWYCISASCDVVMESAIKRGKVGVGVKLAICNAVVLTVRFLLIVIWK